MYMPKVSKCEVGDCAYNAGQTCHAMAITIDANTPKCDTFFGQKAEEIDTSVEGGVGACKAENCRYNKGLECTAEGIMVSKGTDQADCMTFELR
mgnify:CR=1 FL=1